MHHALAHHINYRLRVLARCDLLEVLNSSDTRADTVTGAAATGDRGRARCRPHQHDSMGGLCEKELRSLEMGGRQIKELHCIAFFENCFSLRGMLKQLYGTVHVDRFFEGGMNMKCCQEAELSCYITAATSLFMVQHQLMHQAP